MTIITPSTWLKNLAQQSYLGKYPIYNIYNGIDLNVFYPRAINEKERETIKDKYGIAGKFVILGVASVWEERKGLKYFIELARKLDLDSKIVIVGIADKEKRILPDSVIGINKTSDANELAELYSIADVFINPTLEDNFPTTNIEALACGTPVITFDTGGSSESLDKKCGYVIPKGNIELLFDKIIEIKNGSISRSDCLNRAKLFDKNLKYKEYISIYESKSGKY